MSIVFKEVGKTYDNGVEALKNISVRIEQGEFITIIGLSGAGKSTFLKCVNRIHDVTAGELYVNDVNPNTLHGKDLRAYKRKIGMVFQSFNLISKTTVLRNVLASRVASMPWWKTALGLYSKADKIVALEALEKVGILEKAYTRADQLSGGQQQRVALARTVAQEPNVILADEPVASLDPITAKQVMDDFKRINEKENITVIANMHHVDLALQYAKRVIGIKDGLIVFDGPVDKVNEAVLVHVYGRKLTDDDYIGE
ncbi:Phosphate-import ATP-binding protein PhnC [Candidatus Izimaplasma bacterium HR1]|jgi:phosphonate transport system ATP-binding protein|uniref:phosphonate ABC transporter ATP-binding protein n=1 Tax=Candidatus Izimoplasma sp. HR1 TaxID=1541959 RepID=UPI0004F8C77A|nr:Phosphate-import ATP-binding protein PhnC [Candidatus Izimaplasma bacterium HR1]